MEKYVLYHVSVFLCGKSVNICRRIQITGECSKETGISS